MDYSEYKRYQEMLEDIRVEARDAYSTRADEKAKKQVRALFRNLYATYGSDDEQVQWLESEFDWFL